MDRPGLWVQAAGKGRGAGLQRLLPPYLRRSGFSLLAVFLMIRGPARIRKRRIRSCPGSVDLAQVTDPVIRHSIEEQIRNFGRVILLMSPFRECCGGLPRPRPGTPPPASVLPCLKARSAAVPRPLPASHPLKISIPEFALAPSGGVGRKPECKLTTPAPAADAHTSQASNTPTDERRSTHPLQANYPRTRHAGSEHYWLFRLHAGSPRSSSSSGGTRPVGPRHPPSPCSARAPPRALDSASWAHQLRRPRPLGRCG